MADYERSLELLKHAKETVNELTTKSGLMLGLSEEWHEIISVMQDIRDVGCNILTIGQYLSPKRDALPIHRYYTPEEFEMLKIEGEQLGFKHIEAGPLVRSSYHAKMQSDSVFAEI
jgi:lipoic acid synthetase